MHDARRAALVERHGIMRILTLNLPDSRGTPMCGLFIQVRCGHEHGSSSHFTRFPSLSAALFCARGSGAVRGPERARREFPRCWE
jgi:hypothetical protein